ncbi:MAG: hypothetical protein ACRDHX_00225, partial [Chloroflexota bacterium]
GDGSACLRGPTSECDVRSRRRRRSESVRLIMTDTSIEYPDREFQIWGYTVSMRRLLLRSTKSEHFGRRVDVAFQNVQAMRLRSSLPGLVISSANGLLTEEITKETGLLPDEKQRFFSVAASNFDGYVVAGVVVRSEDDREYYEPSEVWPGGPGQLS